MRSAFVVLLFVVPMLAGCSSPDASSPETTRSKFVLACAVSCGNVSVPPGSVLAEGSLVSGHNVSLNALGPEGDSGVFFFDDGREDGRWIRWRDTESQFQAKGDWHVVGNATATGFVGTATPVTTIGGTTVVLTTAALEGAELAVFARGSGKLVNGSALVALPLAFSVVAAPGLITAQVTLTARGAPLFVAEKAADRLVVESVDGAGDASFDWFVQAPRKSTITFTP